MPWTKRDYPDSMKNLDESVRNKAIEIASRLLEDDYDEGRAIPIAISQAKEWHDNRGGEAASEITHHLVPEGDKWVLKGKDNDERFEFETKEEAMVKVDDLIAEKKVKVMIHDSDGNFQKVR